MEPIAGKGNGAVFRSGPESAPFKDSATQPAASVRHAVVGGSRLGRPAAGHGFVTDHALTEHEGAAARLHAERDVLLRRDAKIAGSLGPNRSIGAFSVPRPRGVLSSFGQCRVARGLL
jgi:hypothetical protein